MKINLLRDKVGKLYFTFIASAIGSTFVTTVYSTVDIICVGQYLGPNGSAAISCVNPFWPIMLCMGFLFGIGGSVLMSNRRGAGSEKEGDEFFTLSIIFSLIFSIIILGVFVFMKRELLTLFGASGEVLEISLEYMRVLVFTAPSFTLCATVSAFVRCDGEAILPTVATIIGGIVNIFGDIFFVFDFGLGLGAFGAGLATSLGQIVAFLIILSYFFRKKCKLRFAKISNSFNKLLKISALGFSAFIVEISFGITSVVFNNVIMERLSSVHLAIFGTASSVLIMFYCFFYAVGTALQPIVSANYGASAIPRVKKTLHIAIIYALALGAAFTLVSQLMPETILNIFMDTTPQIMKIGPNILRMYTLSLPIVGVSILSTYYFQSILRGSLAVVISLLRGIVFPIAFVFALPMIFDISSIWFAVPLSECITCAFAILFFCRTGRVIEAEKLSQVEL